MSEKNECRVCENCGEKIPDGYSTRFHGKEENYCPNCDMTIFDGPDIVDD